MAQNYSIPPPQEKLFYGTDGREEHAWKIKIVSLTNEFKPIRRSNPV
jgi:hypothetical protein